MTPSHLHFRSTVCIDTFFTTCSSGTSPALSASPCMCCHMSTPIASHTKNAAAVPHQACCSCTPPAQQSSSSVQHPRDSVQHSQSSQPVSLRTVKNARLEPPRYLRPHSTISTETGLAMSGSGASPSAASVTMRCRVISDTGGAPAEVAPLPGRYTTVPLPLAPGALPCEPAWAAQAHRQHIFLRASQ